MKLIIHRIIVNNCVYLKSEDVVNYIRELASTEETDVRNRFNEAADNIKKLDCQIKEKK